MISPERKALLFVIAGPSGSGKTTLSAGLVGAFPSLQRAITATTRLPRDGERNGVDYYFFSREEFQKRIDAGEFLEWAEVFNHFYGTLKSEVFPKLQANRDVILSIDVQGVKTVLQNKDPFLKERLVTIFVTPKDVETLRQRLFGRASDAPQDIALRLQVALNEAAQFRLFDYCVLSQTPEEDFIAAKSIYIAEKLRLKR
jgi:guanylate kinase